MLTTIDPPPYAAWDSRGYLLLMMMPVTGLAAGLLGLRRDSVLLAVAGSFWVAQSLAGWFATCLDIGSSASCGPGAGILGLVFAAFLAAVLGVVPLSVVYAIASRGRRNEASRRSGAPACPRCANPLPADASVCLACGLPLS